MKTSHRPVCSDVLSSLWVACVPYYRNNLPQQLHRRILRTSCRERKYDLLQLCGPILEGQFFLKTKWFLCLFPLLVLMGCGTGVNVLEPAVATVALSASPTSIAAGGSSALTATATGATQVIISGSDGSRYTLAPTGGTQTVTPASTTTYIAMATASDSRGGATMAPLTLTVAATAVTTAVTTAGVTVTAPANNSTVGSPAVYVASATTSCPQGVAAMGIYVNNALVYQVAGASMNAPIALGVGNQSTVVQEWDYCGGSTETPVDVSVSGTTISPVSGTTIYDVQSAPGWNQWGELPPVYDVCSPCTGINWAMAQNQQAISTSGNSTAFTIGGTAPYADVLWSYPVIGQGNKQNLTDSNHTLLPNLHNFILDTDVYVSNLAVTQDLEFDINWYGNGVGMEWGTECNHLADGVWDIWDNVNAKWVPTSIPCVLKDGTWNHVTLQVQRQPNNDLLYQSVTVNGQVYPINVTVPPFAVPADWWGMTVNYQMDGDYKMDSNTTYLDKTNFTYW